MFEARSLLLNDALLHRVILVSVLNIIGNVIDANLALISILDVAGDPALLSVIAAHLLFNMKEAGEKGLIQGTSCSSTSTVSGIDFAISLPATASESQDEASETETVELELC